MNNADPSNAESENIKPTEELLRGSNYRCPVCGEMVDPSDAEQILLHHEHVTRPRDFVLARTAAA